jgi:hypothetical protein
MKAKHDARLVGRLLAGGTAVAAASYATYAAITWYRYGRTKRQVNLEESDALLDLFIQEYEIAERHHIRVAAPAEITFAAACEMNLSQSAIARAIFKTRELALGCAASIARREFWARCQTNSQREETLQQKEFLAEMKELGWGVLAEIPLARAKFRRYWSLVSPGVILIRRTLLRGLKAEAERRTRESKPEYETAEFGRYSEP